MYNFERKKRYLLRVYIHLCDRQTDRQKVRETDRRSICYGGKDSSFLTEKDSFMSQVEKRSS